MGEKLLEYYSKAEKAGGVLYTVRLAMKSGMSSGKAKEAPDSQENIAKFEKAYKEITG